MTGEARVREAVVVGGGPVGLATALGLAQAGGEVVVLEARPTLEVQDRRTLALSEGSRCLLEELGAWPRDGVTPIYEIHVSQQGRFGQTMLRAEECAVPALGYVMRYNTLMQALALAVARAPITVHTGARVDALIPGVHRATVSWCHQREGGKGKGGEEKNVEGKAKAAAGENAAGKSGRSERLDTALAVLADGGRALAEASFGVPCQTSYPQVALVGLVNTDQPVTGRAYERFTPAGPVALLPLASGYALVWTAPQQVAEALLALPEREFLERLQEHFGTRAGQFVAVGERSIFPLILKVLPQVTRPHAICLGNAAQTLHPVAGQGFNLGLRDASALGKLARAPDLAWGSSAQLERYLQQRRRDRYAGIGATHALVALFSNAWPLLSQLRGGGLLGLELWPPARRALARFMMFGAGGA